MPIDPSSGLKQSGQISLNGTGGKSTNGLKDGSNIGKEFLSVGDTGTVAMGSLYKASTGETTTGSPVPDSTGNNVEALPASGQISMSDFYRTSNAVDPSDLLTETIFGRGNLTSDSMDGGYAYARGGSNQSSTAKVTYSTSMNNVFYTTRTSTSNTWNPNMAGWDMIIQPRFSAAKLNDGNISHYSLRWLVRPYVQSSTYTDASGNTSSINTSTYQEIYRIEWKANVEAGGADVKGYNERFRYAPTSLAWNYAEYDTQSGGNPGSNSYLSFVNSGYSTGTGDGTHYYMPPVGATSNTVYTYGDGDGPYNSTAASSWIGAATGNNQYGGTRGARITVTNSSECQTITTRKQIAMNFSLIDPANSTDGSTGANTGLNSAGYHSFVSPTFVFDIQLVNIHSGVCQ